MREGESKRDSGRETLLDPADQENGMSNLQYPYRYLYTIPVTFVPRVDDDPITGNSRAMHNSGWTSCSYLEGSTGDV